MMIQALMEMGTKIPIALTTHLVRRGYPTKRRNEVTLQSSTCIAKGASLFFSAR
jgi:hypothetical protein